MQDAIELGMTITEFMDITPAELSIFFQAMQNKIKNDNDNAISLAWTTAYFQRVKKLPPLSKFVKPRPMTEQEIFMKSKAIFGG
jgi:hypothetical protein